VAGLPERCWRKIQRGCAPTASKRGPGLPPAPSAVPALTRSPSFTRSSTRHSGTRRRKTALRRRAPRRRFPGVRSSELRARVGRDHQLRGEVGKAMSSASARSISSSTTRGSIMRRAQCICNRYKLRAFRRPPRRQMSRTARILDQDSQAAHLRVGCLVRRPVIVIVLLAQLATSGRITTRKPCRPKLSESGSSRSPR